VIRIATLVLPEIVHFASFPWSRIQLQSRRSATVINAGEDRDQLSSSIPFSANGGFPMPVTALFLDLGGVLLTNGWDRNSRQLAANTFGLDHKEMDERHHLTFDTYEAGKLTLEQYLSRVVFYEKRSFSAQEFREFMFSQSKAFPEMIELVRTLKAQYKLKVAVVNNEGRELNECRIQKFKLDSFVDFFISSCIVHVRKPDEDIYRIALDIAHVRPEQVAYLDDRLMFVQVAEALGIRGVHHVDYASTCEKLASLGLKLEERRSNHEAV
jgi:putative hydrolase of the HAD superfamily